MKKIFLYLTLIGMSALVASNQPAKKAQETFDNAIAQTQAKSLTLQGQTGYLFWQKMAPLKEVIPDERLMLVSYDPKKSSVVYHLLDQNLFFTGQTEHHSPDAFQKFVSDGAKYRSKPPLFPLDMVPLNGVLPIKKTLYDLVNTLDTNFIPAQVGEQQKWLGFYDEKDTEAGVKSPLSHGIFALSAIRSRGDCPELEKPGGGYRFYCNGMHKHVSPPTDQQLAECKAKRINPKVVSFLDEASSQSTLQFTNNSTTSSGSTPLLTNQQCQAAEQFPLLASIMAATGGAAVLTGLYQLVLGVLTRHKIQKLLAARVGDRIAIRALQRAGTQHLMRAGIVGGSGLLALTAGLVLLMNRS